MPLAYGIGGLIKVPAGALSGNGAPPASFKGELGQSYFDTSTNPFTQYTYNGSTWQAGANAAATETVAGIARLSTDDEATTGTNDTTIMTPAKVALVALQGVSDATEVTKGVAFLATQAEAEAGTDDTKIMTPLKVAQAVAAGNGAGSFTSLDASGAVTFASTGAIEMTSDTASFFDVTGAGTDLTLSSDAGRVIVNGEEAAANAITLLSAAGGIDADAALQVNIASSQNAVDAIRIVASAGGIDIDAVGAATEDINITNTGGSIVLSASENVADSIVLNSTAGGIDITAAGAAGEDIDIVNTAGSVVISGGEAVADAVNIDAPAGGIDVDAVGQINIASSQNAADAVVIIASAGGVDITATGAAGEDLDLLASGSSVNVTATENAAQAIYIRANGGISETIDIHSDQGTGAASINVHSDVGGVTVASGLASADAINLNASNAAGGIDIDAGTAGVIVDTTGGISLDAAAASNFTATGAFDVTVNSTAGSVIINGEEAVTDAIQLQSAAGGIDVNAALEINIDSSEAAVADAVRIVASAADGGIDIDAGTGGIAIDSTGAVSIDGAAASNFAVSGAGIDLTLDSSAGRLVLTGGEAAADAVRIQADDAAGGIDIDSGTGGIAIDSTGVLSLDSAGATNLTATGAFDVTVNSTAGSVIVSASESAADALQLLSTAGGIDILASGAAAGEDIDIVATGSSVNITSTEADAAAIVLNASDAAGGIDLSTGGGSIDLSSAGAVSMVPATASVASPTASATENSRVGRVLFTGFTTASGADQDFTITNSTVTTSSGIFVTVSNVQNANDCDMTLEGVRVSSGSFVVHTTNNGPAALDGNVIITWWVIS